MEFSLKFQHCFLTFPPWISLQLLVEEVQSGFGFAKNAVRQTDRGAAAAVQARRAQRRGLALRGPALHQQRGARSQPPPARRPGQTRVLHVPGARGRRRRYEPARAPAARQNRPNAADRSGARSQTGSRA